MREGRCLCGGVAWELTGEPFRAYNCHCKMCRKVHGAAFGTYYFVRPDQFRWTSDTDTVVHYRSSHIVTRGSCDVCGSVVSYSSDGRETWAAPASHIFVAHKAGWHDITDDLPRYEEGPPG